MVFYIIWLEFWLVLYLRSDQVKRDPEDIPEILSKKRPHAMQEKQLQDMDLYLMEGILLITY